jgi:hypothetical protein
MRRSAAADSRNFYPTGPSEESGLALFGRDDFYRFLIV